MIYDIVAMIYKTKSQLLMMSLKNVKFHVLSAIKFSLYYI